MNLKTTLNEKNIFVMTRNRPRLSRRQKHTNFLKLQFASWFLKKKLSLLSSLVLRSAAFDSNTQLLYFVSYWIYRFTCSYLDMLNVERLFLSPAQDAAKYLTKFVLLYLTTNIFKTNHLCSLITCHQARCEIRNISCANRLFWAKYYHIHCISFF